VSVLASLAAGCAAPCLRQLLLLLLSSTAAAAAAALDCKHVSCWAGTERPCRLSVPLLHPVRSTAFLPLDVSWPASRLTHVILQARPSLLVHDTTTASAALGAAAAVAAAGSGARSTACCKLLHVDTLFVPGLTESYAKVYGSSSSSSTLSRGNMPPLPWYCVMFTSGSTGTPLGVLATEAGFLNRFEWMQQQQHAQLHSGHVLRSALSPTEPMAAQTADKVGAAPVHISPIPLRPGHVVALRTAPGFVDHLWEMLAPLLAGADLLVIQETSRHEQRLPNCSLPKQSTQAARSAGRGQAKALPQETSDVLHRLGAGTSTPADTDTLPSCSGSGTAGVAAAATAAAAATDAAAAAAAPVIAPRSAAEQPPPIALRPRDLVALLQQHNVTHLTAVPSLLALWAPELLRAQHRLQLMQVVSSGAPLACALAGTLLDALPQRCVLLNLYGTTEVSADATWQPVTRQLLSVLSAAAAAETATTTAAAAAGGACCWVPAGAPIPGMTVAVTAVVGAAGGGGTSSGSGSGGSGSGGGSSSGNGDGGSGRIKGATELHLAAAGEEGEVWLAGAGLAQGYLTPAMSGADSTSSSSSRSSGCGRFVQLLRLLSPSGGPPKQQQPTALSSCITGNAGITDDAKQGPGVVSQW
jgi:acyl-CoA synthetase (AMP-forming)/AMP-acid ligase II